MGTERPRTAGSVVHLPGGSSGRNALGTHRGGEKDSVEPDSPRLSYVVGTDTGNQFAPASAPLWDGIGLQRPGALDGNTFLPRPTNSHPFVFCSTPAQRGDLWSPGRSNFWGTEGPNDSPKWDPLSCRRRYGWCGVVWLGRGRPGQSLERACSISPASLGFRKGPGERKTAIT
jgi:hypothetical protein